MLLLVSTVDPDESTGFVLELGKLNAEFLDGLFEMCDFVIEAIFFLIGRCKLVTEFLDGFAEIRYFFPFHMGNRKRGMVSTNALEFV